ncbi:hypothetical protein [Aquimarina megaterium]|uniref:hypothetical protein n=1 Tax=Aquimarina megaterium TaxID=1443666 RepID=UPI0009454480|nr:hypothetical protein [Aquimarina megaterium]
MSRKKKIDKTAENVELRYGNWLSILIALIAPKNLYAILGRGTGKTTDILAQRAQDICYDMQGAYVAISSDTYMNALKNVIPSLIEGWERNGWIEGIHFVVGQRPPKHFKKPYKPPISWKHTITAFTGTHFKIISQDRPSTGAGDSYQHIIGDEIKYQSEKKINKLTPAIRGEYTRFGHSHYYGGRTFTSDMPNPNHGEHDWVMRMEKNMDMDQIKLILQTSLVVNEIKIELMNAELHGNDRDIRKHKKLLKVWEERLSIARKDSTFFHIASSYANADILREGFFKDILETMNFREVMTSILSIPPTLERGQMFYPNLSKSNFYSDGFRYDRYDTENRGDKVEGNCLDLRCLNLNQTLEAGFDSGKMCSLVIGQPESEEIYRILKDFHTIPPEFIPQLGQKFREYFIHQKKKHLQLYHDRAANKMQSVGEDHASKLKKAIEYDLEGKSTGWTVELMNRNQATIYHQEEYELMLEMFKGKHKDLPMVLIDKFACSVLKSSIERAEVIIKEDRHGKKTIHKNKSSEQLPDEMLPLFSTNMSDAMKYLLCRRAFLDMLKGTGNLFSVTPGIH